MAYPMSHGAALVLALGVVGVGSLACGGSPAFNTLQLMPIPGRALSGTEGQALVVTPVLFVRSADPLGWGRSLDRPRDYMRHADTLIETSLTQHAAHTKWVFPAAIERQVKRNPGYVSDPYALSGAQLLPGVWRAGEPIQEPLAGQLRGLVTFQENARYVLIPVEVHFIPYRAQGDTAAVPKWGRGVLRMALYDARSTLVMWEGDVIGDSVATPAEAMPSVARRLGETFGAY
jgi:hypothetical protein